MQIADRIEKKVTLRAPVSRVWRAITDSGEFGRWFGVRLDGPFVAGQSVRGIFDGPLPEDAIREFQQAQGLPPSPIRAPAPNAVFCTVERIEPERFFSFRWIPYGIDAAIDPATEPTTLVEFQLERHGERQGEGTSLTVVESGFERVPEHRRRRAFLMNDAGWTQQVTNLAHHVESA